MAGKKILVADDSLTIQKVIKLALSNEGYEIKSVSDGIDAVQEISLFRPDVVLIDVTLPGKSAFEVKAAIRENDLFSDVQFVLMSSAYEKVDEKLVTESQFHARLTKPFDPSQLRELVARLAQTSQNAKQNLTSLGIPAGDPPMSTSFNPDSDIKKLTESTIALTEGGDFAGWSIESAPGSMKSEFVGFDDPVLPPMGEIGTFKPEQSWSPSTWQPETEAAPIFEPLAFETSAAAAPAASAASASTQLNEAQIERAVHAAVQKAVENTIQKLLPEIAERVIKAEIRKLLEEN